MVEDESECQNGEVERWILSYFKSISIDPKGGAEGEKNGDDE